MNDLDGDPAIRLALAYARASDRPVFEALFALDRRLADAVRQAIAAFGEGRATAWSVAARTVHQGEASPRYDASLWAYADLAAHCSSPEDAERVREVARNQGLLDRAPPRLPRPLRTLGVLGALGRRSLRSGRPILSGGGDFLAAVRTGMLGR